MPRSSVKSKANADFWESYDRLTPAVQRIADQQFRLWKSNPSHPSLHFKKLQGDLYSARVTRNYRALAVKTADGFIWFWIGHHDVYEHIIES